MIFPIVLLVIILSHKLDGYYWTIPRSPMAHYGLREALSVAQELSHGQPWPICTCQSPSKNRAWLIGLWDPLVGGSVNEDLDGKGQYVWVLWKMFLVQSDFHVRNKFLAQRIRVLWTCSMRKKIRFGRLAGDFTPFWWSLGRRNRGLAMSSFCF